MLIVHTGGVDDQNLEPELDGPARNRELASLEPVGGGLLELDETVEAVRVSRGESLRNTLDHLAAFYGSRDTTAEMESGRWESSASEADPLVTTPLRLPKSVLDRVRRRAAAENEKPMEWIRAAVESKLTELDA